MDGLKNLFLFSGLGKESYRNVKQGVRTENRKTLIVFSMLGFIGFISSLIVSVITGFGMGNAAISSMCGIFFGMTILAMFATKKYPVIINWLCYLFTAMILSIGVYAGVVKIDQRTTLLLPFFIFSAVLFYERLIIIVSQIVVAEVIYLSIIINYQSGELFTTNASNSAIFCVVGVFTAGYIMKMKYKKIEAEYNNRQLIEKDSLTSLYNRRSYEHELQLVKINKVPVAICAFDINGLKDVNDTLGHSAGDELIVGSAYCINEVFGKYGKVFRTGGDEFMAILDKEVGNTDRMHQEFISLMSSWKGREVSGINVSCGIAIVNSDYETRLEEALKEADKLMYIEKRQYYERTGIERRKQGSV